MSSKTIKAIKAKCRNCHSEGCEHCDPMHHRVEQLAHIADGAETLGEVAARLRNAAAEYAALARGKWTLREQVDAGHMYLERAQ